MSILATLTRPLKALRRLGSNPTPGPEAIVNARRELTADRQVLTAQLGEPRLEDYSGEFSTDVKAVVPLHTPRYTDPAPMTFDVEGPQLSDFCRALDTTVANIGDLEGESVPIYWDNGTPLPDWDAIAQEGDK